MSDDKPGRRGPAGGRDSTGRGGDSRAGGGRGSSSYAGRVRRESGDRGEAPRGSRGGSSGAPGERGRSDDRDDRRRDERPRDDRRSGGQQGERDRGGRDGGPRREGAPRYEAGPRRDSGPRREGGPRREERGGQRGGAERSAGTFDNSERRSGTRLAPKSPRLPEPRIAEGVTGKELDRSVHQQLRTLSKENAEGVAQHLVMVAALLEAEDFAGAEAHAETAVRRAGRVPAAREALGLVAYRKGEWARALSEFRTARRLSGSSHMLPLMVDCERGLGGCPR